jgi:Na+-translocating ferredoxin:NAD+ oxidoreductase RnfA subunit
MSIGTGIFLSALFLGCIVLYVKSENKAKWRKCLLTSLGGLVGFCVIYVLVANLR